MPKTSKTQFLSLPEILLHVDKEAVAKAILKVEEGERQPLDFEFEDAKKLVWLAAEKWLPRDLATFTLEGTEIHFEQEVVAGIRPVKGFIDVGGTVKEGAIEPFKQFAGQKYCLDWKTSKNTLGTDWRQRLVDSFQWMLYSEIYKASVFLYRGLSRNGTTSEVIIQVPQTNESEVIQQISGIGVQLNVLENFEVYPRNKPFACQAYGRTCPFYDDCNDYTMPRAPLPVTKKLSYSFMQDFMLCNERARRESLLEGNGGDSEESAFGKLVHKGLAEMWKQAYENIDCS